MTMEKFTIDRNSLRKFGLMMSAAFLIISVVVFLKGRHSILATYTVSFLFLFFAIIAPLLLKPVYIGWMRLAFVLSWINTRLLLCIIFYLILAPMGIGMRIFGADPLDRKIDKKKVSYWNQNEKRELSVSDYERQF